MILPLLGPPQRMFNSVSPMLEFGAYEFLWQQGFHSKAASFKSLADAFRDLPGVMPSDLVSRDAAIACAREVLERFEKKNVGRFSIRVKGLNEYPDGLSDAEHPLQLFYYQGNWALAEAPQRVAIVGTRTPSEEGVRRARKLAALLSENKTVVVSGLAAGIDTAAHQGAIENGGETIAVIGTPLDQTYPKENAELQRTIAERHLLISQIPVLAYSQRPPTINRFFFPERNVTMSALTHATVIVEAGETSGTLVQARAAIAQGRKLFILESNFNNPALKWPHKFAEKGAIRVRHVEDILAELSPAAS